MSWLCLTCSVHVKNDLALTVRVDDGILDTDNKGVALGLIVHSYGIERYPWFEVVDHVRDRSLGGEFRHRREVLKKGVKNLTPNLGMEGDFVEVREHKILDALLDGVGVDSLVEIIGDRITSEPKVKVKIISDVVRHFVFGIISV